MEWCGFGSIRSGNGENDRESGGVSGMVWLWRFDAMVPSAKGELMEVKCLPWGSEERSLRHALASLFGPKGPDNYPRLWMGQHRTDVEMCVSFWRAYLIKEFLLHLISCLLRCCTVIDAVPIEGTDFPIFDHNLVFSAAPGVVAAKSILKLEWHLAWRLFAGFPIFPKSLLH